MSANLLNPKYYNNPDPIEAELLLAFRKKYPKKNYQFHKHQIEYFSGGNGDRTLLLFHGAASDAESLYRRFLQFDSHYKVIGVTMNHFSTHQEVSECINQILKREGMKKVVVMGGSFGGLTAQAYFHRNYAEVEGLILSVTFPPDPSWQRDFQKTIKLMGFIPEKLLKKIFKAKLMKLWKENIPDTMKGKILFYKSYFEEMVATRINKSHIMTELRLTADFCNDLYAPDQYPLWKGKVLIFTANDDANFKYHEKLAHQYPNVEEIIWQNVGHIGAFIMEEEFLTKIERFLKE